MPSPTTALNQILEQVKLIELKNSDTKKNAIVSSLRIIALIPLPFSPKYYIDNNN